MTDESVPTAPITAVSYSRLAVFETCPYQAKLKFADKVPEPPEPPDTETPLSRGSRIHKDAENYVLGLGTLTPELSKFEADLYALHQRFIEDPKSVEVEQMWCFDLGWTPVDQFDWDNIWLRVKQDAVVHLAEDAVLCVDHKTGRKDGNEVKHLDQLRLAALAATFKYPQAEVFYVENWYIDQDQMTHFEYTRQEVMGMLPDYNARLLAVTEAVEFPPKPSKVNCRYCPYRSGKIDKHRQGTGDCSFSFYTR